MSFEVLEVNLMESILEVRDLKKHFPIKAGLLSKQVAAVKATDGVSFTIKTGETLGLVGESGCGKTTTSLTLLNLLDPTSGEVYFGGRNIFKMSRKERQKLRREMQIVFQDPFSSLNPRMTCYELIEEPLVINHHLKKSQRKERVLQTMKKVGLLPEDIYKYPHEFSGGQRQRLGIARALIVEPKFLVADEPVSSIDVSVRAQILNLIKDLRKEFNLTILLVSHDLCVVRYICDRVAVMYLGKLVELATTEELFNNPRHPYTNALLSAVPIPDPEARHKRIILSGEPPTPINPPPGCRFHPRCEYAKPICAEVEPTLTNIGTVNEHYVACHLERK